MKTLEMQLRTSPWAPCLSEDELAQVIHASYLRHVAAGATVFRRDEPVHCWLGVIEGLVKLSMSQADGRESTVTGITAGAWVGEAALLKTGFWGHDGVAVCSSEIACVPRHCFERLVASNLAFNRFLLKQLSTRLIQFVDTVVSDRLLSPEARVARCLASLFDPVLYPLAQRQLRLNQGEIGLLAGLSRQRANQALRTLERAGLLHIEFAGITVLDLPGLRSFDADSAEPLATRPQALVCLG